MEKSREKKLRPCCVPGCGDRTSPRFSIPSGISVRGMWVRRIKNEALQDSDDPVFLHNHPVCKNNFALMCFDNSGRLKKFSLPTLNLPDYREPSTEENCFCRPKAAKYPYVTPEKLRDILRKLPAPDATAGSSPSKENVSPLPHVQQPVRVYRRAKRTIFTPVSHSDEPGPSTAGVSSVPATTERSHDLDQELSDFSVRVLPRTPSPS